MASRSYRPADLRRAVPIAVLVWGATAWGQTQGEVEAWVRAGVEARRGQRDGEALGLFERAYAARPSAMVRVQIALAHQALGRWREAERGLMASLEGHDAWIEARRSALTESLAEVRRHLGDVEVVGSPAGATVSLDSEVVGTLPLAAPVRWSVGTARLTVAAPGMETVTRPVVVEASQLTRESVTLAAVPAPVPVPVVVMAPTVLRVPVVEAPRRASRGPWVLGVAGASVAVIGSVVGFALRAEASSSLASSGCVEAGNAWVCPSSERVESEAAQGRGEAASTALTVSLIAGGAALVGAVVWGVLGRRREAERVGAGPWRFAVSF